MRKHLEKKKVKERKEKGSGVRKVVVNGSVRNEFVNKTTTST